MGDDKFPRITSAEGGRPTNRKQLSPNELKKLTPLQRSRYMAYEEPPKEIDDARKASQKRLINLKKMRQMQFEPLSREEEEERDKHEKLIGQLKAAEARNRLRIMRLR